MGFFNTTSAFLAALVSGEARIVTPEELKEVQAEIQSAYDHNQTTAAYNSSLAKQLAIEKAQLEASFERLKAETAEHAQACRTILAQKRENEVKALDIMHRKSAVQVAESKAIINALYQQNHAWEVGQREYDLLFHSAPVVTKKQWGKSLDFIASTAVIAGFAYIAKRAYDAHKTVQSTKGGVGAVIDKTLSLIESDLDWCCNTIRAKLFGKK